MAKCGRGSSEPPTTHSRPASCLRHPGDSPPLGALAAPWAGRHIVILLNAVFGIIIDSFGELRAFRKEIKKKNETECFICGIERFKLDTKGGGFDRHIRLHHNMWNYLRMLTMLREKDDLEYNGWESWIASRLKEADTSFFPRDALSLKAITEMELAEEQTKAAQAAHTANTVLEMSAAMASIKERQDEIVSTVHDLTASIEMAKEQQDLVAQRLASMSYATPLRPTPARPGGQAILGTVDVAEAPPPEEHGGGERRRYFIRILPAPTPEEYGGSEPSRYSVRILQAAN